MGSPCALVGRYPIVTLAEARDKALENARAVTPRKRAARPLACPYVQASRYQDKKRRQREAQPQRKREQRRRPTWTASERSGAVVKAASNATLPAAQVMAAGLW